MGTCESYLEQSSIQIDYEKNNKRIQSQLRIQNVSLKNVKVTINYQENKILIKPIQEIIINQLKVSPDMNVRKVMNKIEKIQNKSDRLQTMHYLMAQENSQGQQQQTKLVLEQAQKSMIKQEEKSQNTQFIPTNYKQINESFESFGINLDWTKKSGIKSAISIHVLSGLAGNMLRCSFRQQNTFQPLIDNHGLLSQHYDEIKKRIATKFQINQNIITILEVTKGSVITSFVINADYVMSKLQNKNSLVFKSGETLTVHPYFENFKLSPEDFDPFGNCDYTKDPQTDFEQFRRRVSKRGGYDYYKPLKCKRYGLKVFDRYDDNDWLVNSQTQWAIGYHGVWSPGNIVQNREDNTQKFVLNAIMQQRILKPGVRQLYADYPCQSHSNCKIPKGVYLTPNIEVAMNFAGVSKMMSNNKQYRLAFQCRIQPSKIHKIFTEDKDQYWIVENSQFIRPYGIVLQNQ